MKKFRFAVAVLMAAVAGAVCAATDYTRFVNPFIGTGGHGHTFPGAVVPHGMIQPSPDTRIMGWDACSGYHYPDSQINGFAQTHLSGTGCADYGDLLIMPTVGAQDSTPQADTTQNTAYASLFSHDSEVAEPGYYSVFLDRYAVRAEITASDRSAVYRFTYPRSMDAGMILDLDYSINRQWNRDMRVEVLGDTAIRAYKMTAGWAPRQQISMYARFSRPFKAEVVRDSVTDRDGDRIGLCKVLLKFGKTRKDEQILVKLALSAVDWDGARKNLAAEIPGWDFDAVRAAAVAKWNDYLSKIQITADNADDRTIFYTAMYHAAISPNLFQDIDGHYPGMDGKAHQGDPSHPVYTVFSLWDTHRALHPFYTIIDPKLNNDFIKSLLLKYRDGGILPMWELAGNYTATMPGYHAVSPMADAVAKGIADFDVSLAYRAARRSAEGDTVGIKARPAFRKALMPLSKKYKNELGYIPWDKEVEAVAKGLEYAYDDFCVALLAEAAGDSVGQRLFESRARNYRHYFDPVTRFMRGKDEQGRWHEPFSPRSSNHRSDDYCEGTAWQWTWFVPHDVDGLIGLMGGKECFADRLDSLFTADSSLEGETVSSDISGLIGQYAHGNEPSHHIIHLHNYAGRPWRTQELVDRVLKEQYRNDPDGISGNEDCGQMSAWYILNSLGFYQVCPGKPVYSIGRPWFPKAVVNLPDGRKIRITVKNYSKDNKYIREVKLNGRRLTEPFFTHADIIDGADFEYEMTDRPCPSAFDSEPADLVNPFIGTSCYGTTNPGAVTPNGLMSVSPFNVMGSDLNRYDKDSRWWSTPYDNNNEYFTGFSHVNLSGVGCPELGSLLVTATAGPLDTDYHNYGSTYSRESATPGYYSLHLDKYGILAEATATPRTGRIRFTLPAGQSNILLNLGEGLTNETGATVRRLSDTVVTGSKLMGTFCYNPSAVFPLYFAMRVNRKPAGQGFWKFQRPKQGVEAQWDKDNARYKLYDQKLGALSGDDIGVWYTYDSAVEDTVEVSVGVSFVSEENALLNLDTEQPAGTTFDGIAAAARRKWNEALGRIQVEGGTDKDKTVFYTALYHTLIHPNILQDVNGEYPAMESGEVLKTDRDRYTVFSLWDTYRNLHQLMTLVYPERQLDMVRTMVDMSKEWGWLPKWELFGRETFTMEGDPAVPVIADTWNKGLRDFDIDAAYRAMKKSAVTPGRDNPMRPDNDPYVERGYIPLGYFAADLSGDNSVSHALEYYVADNVLAGLARSRGDNAFADSLQRRASGWRNYYSRESGTLRPLNADGTFLTPFNPRQGENFEAVPGFHEGSAWNYTFYVPHDIQGLAKAMGGKKAFVDKLQSVFDLGLYDPANEPDIAYPYLFTHFKGEEWRTAKIVRGLLEKYYRDSPDGLPGNDDTGTMSAWAIFSMMGLYPDIPADPSYAVTVPVFDKITIRPSSAAAPITIEKTRDGQTMINGEKAGNRISHARLTQSQSTQ